MRHPSLSVSIADSEQLASKRRHPNLTGHVEPWHHKNTFLTTHETTPYSIYITVESEPSRRKHNIALSVYSLQGLSILRHLVCVPSQHLEYNSSSSHPPPSHVSHHDHGRHLLPTLILQLLVGAPQRLTEWSSSTAPLILVVSLNHAHTFTLTLTSYSLSPSPSTSPSPSLSPSSSPSLRTSTRTRTRTSPSPLPSLPSGDGALPVRRRARYGPSASKAGKRGVLSMDRRGGTRVK